MASSDHSSADEKRVSHAMSIDDAYRIEQTLSRDERCITELVTIDEAGPFIRKKIPIKIVRRTVWAALADCANSGIPRIQATYETLDWFVVVHDYVPGKTITTYVSETGSLPPAKATEICVKLCEIMSDLHSHGVIHRDISPGNVILGGTDAEQVHLIDFDTACLVHEPSNPNNAARGTWGFAAPEQHGFADVDERSEIYSIGKLLGFMLTGVQPNGPEDDYYVNILKSSKSTPAHLIATVEKACSFDRSMRFQSASEMISALTSAQEAGNGNVNGNEPDHTPGSNSAPGSTPEQGEGSTFRAASGLNDKPGTKRTPPSTGEHASEKTAAPAHRQRKTLVIGLLGVAFVCALAIGVATVVSTLPSQNAAKPDSQTAPESSSGSSDTLDDASGSLNDTLSDIVLDSISGNSSDQDATVDQTESVELELVESGWTHAAGGYINYAFAIRNPSDTETIDYPEVVVTGRASDGSVVFSQPQVLSSIGPGETLYYGAPAGSGTPPDSVEFSLGSSSDYNITDAESPRAAFSFSPIAEVESPFGDVSFTGEVTMSEGAVPKLVNGVAVVIVLRDASGSIVYGGHTYVGLPDPGQNVPFEYGAYGAPDYATVEAHALFW